MRGDANLSDSKVLRIQSLFIKKTEKFAKEYENTANASRAFLYKNTNKKTSLFDWFKNILKIKLF